MRGPGFESHLGQQFFFSCLKIHFWDSNPRPFKQFEYFFNLVIERSWVRIPPWATVFFFHVQKIAIFAYCATLLGREGSKHDSYISVVIIWKSPALLTRSTVAVEFYWLPLSNLDNAYHPVGKNNYFVTVH